MSIPDCKDLSKKWIDVELFAKANPCTVTNKSTHMVIINPYPGRLINGTLTSRITSKYCKLVSADGREDYSDPFRSTKLISTSKSICLDATIVKTAHCSEKVQVSTTFSFSAKDLDEVPRENLCNYLIKLK